MACGRNSEPLLPSSLSLVAISRTYGVRARSSPVLPSPQHYTRLDLARMGFDPDAIEALMTYDSTLLLEQALDLLVKTDKGWKHEFVPQTSDVSKCTICKDEYGTHHPELPGRMSIPSPISPGVKAVRELSLKKCCGICLETVDEQDFYSLQCGHSFCFECLQDYLRLEITEGRVDKLVCPELKCTCEFTMSVLRSLLTADILAKYHRFQRNWKVITNPCALWCPSPDCNNVLYKSEITTRIHCGRCNVQFCATCRVAWHEGKTCEEYFDASYEEWSKGRSVQSCPRCRQSIEKENGCNHITCGACRHQWCWLCRQPYSEMHSLPFNPFGCPGSRKPWYKLWARKLLLLIFLPISTFHLVFPVNFGCLLSRSVSETLGWQGWSRVPLYVLLMLVFLLGCGLGVLLMAVCILPALGLYSYQLVKSMRPCCRRKGRLASSE